MWVPSTSNFFGEGLVCVTLSLQFFFFGEGSYVGPYHLHHNYFFREGSICGSLPPQVFFVTVLYDGPFHFKFFG